MKAQNIHVICGYIVAALSVAAIVGIPFSLYFMLRHLV